MSHVAWSCDGKKLAAVGIDKIVRVWQPEKSVSPAPGTLVLATSRFMGF
jgi:THO complex subunit 3